MYELLVYLASRHSIRPYVYIRPLDLLLRFPRFSYRSSKIINPQRLKETIQGLLVPYSILNLNTEQHFQAFIPHKLPQCKWANELKSSKLEYLNELRVQKSRKDIEESPSPPNFACSPKNADEFMDRLAGVVKKRKIDY